MVACSASARSAADLPGVLASIAQPISEALGFRTVVIDVYRPAWDGYRVVTVHGSEEAREALLGTTTRVELWHPYLDERLRGQSKAGRAGSSSAAGRADSRMVTTVRRCRRAEPAPG